MNLPKHPFFSPFYELLFEQYRDAIYLVDINTGYILDCNNIACLRLGYTRQELLNMHVGIINDQFSDKKSFKAFTEHLITLETKAAQADTFHIRKSQSLLPVEVNYIYQQQDGQQFLIALARDISRQVRDEQVIYRRASFDPLTDLPNRRLLLAWLNKELNNQTEHSIAAIVIDLDFFKDINSGFGRDNADLLLVEVARRIKTCLRNNDLLARLNGDVFAVALSGEVSKDNIKRLAEEILRKFELPFQLGSSLLQLSISLGICDHLHSVNNAETLLTLAERALQTAKKSGRSCYRFFTEDMQLKSITKIEIISDLRKAMDLDQFELHFQPIINLHTQECYKAEALIRWQHPKWGMIGPDKFIGLAEEIGIIARLGDWVFHQTVDYLTQWRSNTKSNLQISINTSPLQYLSENKEMSHWLSILQSKNLPENALGIEITENVLMESQHLIYQQLKAFRNVNIPIAIDDFGTGYSSLSYLRKFSINVIKIDRSFIKDLKNNSDEMVLCEAIILMAHRLGMKVVAEGIETTEQRDLLISANCDYGQGFLFSKPLPASHFEHLISKT